jgi:glycine cleavage system protein P-like pyridoxal-binding family
MARFAKEFTESQTGTFAVPRERQLMIAVTEKKTKADLDALVKALKEVTESQTGTFAVPKEREVTHV